MIPTFEAIIPGQSKSRTESLTAIIRPCRLNDDKVSGSGRR